MSVASSKVFNLVDGFFESVLRLVFRGCYPLQPVFVEKALERAIAENTKVFRKGILPPNRLTVLMNDEDYGEFRKIEGIYMKQITENAERFIENVFKEHSMAVCKPTIFVTMDPDVPRGTVTIIAEHDETGYSERKD